MDCDERWLNQDDDHHSHGVEDDDDLNEDGDDDDRWLNQHGNDLADCYQPIHSGKVERCLLSLEVAHLRQTLSTSK